MAAVTSTTRGMSFQPFFATRITWRPFSTWTSQGVRTMTPVASRTGWSSTKAINPGSGVWMRHLSGFCGSRNSLTGWSSLACWPSPGTTTGLASPLSAARPLKNTPQTTTTKTSSNPAPDIARLSGRRVRNFATRAWVISSMGGATGGCVSIGNTTCPAGRLAGARGLASNRESRLRGGPEDGFGLEGSAGGMSVVVGIGLKFNKTER